MKNEKMKNKCLEAALRYSELGFSVIPVGKDKKPLVKWQKYQSDRASKDQIFQWWRNFPDANVAIVTGAISGLVVLDIDAKNGGIETIRSKEVPPTPTVKTGGGGYHDYCKHPGFEIRNFQKRDDLPGIDLRGDGGYVVAPPSIHPSGRQYEWVKPLNEELADLPPWVLSSNLKPKTPISDLMLGVNEGVRNDSLARIAGLLFADGFEFNEVLTRCSEWNATNSSPLSDDELRRTVESINKRHHARENSSIGHTLILGHISESSHLDNWPDPPEAEAYHGLAGEIVRTLEPHTEADPIAILTQTLVSFGNMVGRNPYFQVEADRHYPNMYSIMVGATSKGRKGTSFGYVRRISETVDPVWVSEHIKSGLSSGEGLIWAVRDSISKTESVKNKGKITGEIQEILVDEGVADKRLLVLEPEFASTLRILGREGNILSPVIRDAWDTGNLRTLTKNCPAISTGAHISVIGHITKDELNRYLNSTEVGNGFANRFVWICVKRSRILPEGGNIEDVRLSHLVTRLRKAIEFAKTVNRVTFDSNARAIWYEVYQPLSDGKPGLVGTIISRSEAQVVRLCMIYALMDSSSEIREEHLLSALSLWEYCEASVKYIFGEALGDPDADSIQRALQSCPLNRGLTLTEIHTLFKRNRKAHEIERALDVLLRQGIAKPIIRTTSGRNEERWILTDKTKGTKKTN